MWSQAGNSLKRGVCVCVCVCVRARGLCGERRQMLAGQTRSSLCTSAAAAAAAPRIPAGRCHGVVSVLSRLSRFCLGFVSVLSRFCLGFVSVSAVFVSVLSRVVSVSAVFVSVLSRPRLSRFCLGVVSLLSRVCLACGNMFNHVSTMVKHCGNTCGNTCGK